jgi:hypothetical protein
LTDETLSPLLLSNGQLVDDFHQSQLDDFYLVRGRRGSLRQPS